MGQELGLPQVPCVYCGHGNPPGHRFCGMCGKALPDLVKQTKPVLGASGSARLGGGTGVAGRVPVPTTSALPVGSANVRPAPAGRSDSPNRDLSYLLHDDDHVPARTSRVPFIAGGVILAAVAVFFVLRGGGKPAPVAGSSGGAIVSQATTPAGTDASTAEPKIEPPKVETPKTEPPNIEPPADTPKVEPEKAEIPPAAAAAPDQAVLHPAPVVTTPRAKPASRPARIQKKPSPSKAAAPEEDTDDAADTAATPSGACEKDLPAMRKAAARGDAKAKADLGLVYYAGRCVPRDLPTAYHWYALALRTAPDSPQISTQLEAIWKQMSPAERQWALKAQ